MMWTVDSADSHAAARGSRLSVLREIGEQSVLDTIYRAGPITRPAIASATGLSKPTVGAAVQRLERARLIRTVGPQHGRRGRSPIAYVVRETAGFVIGIDLGVTTIRVGAADLFGELIDSDQRPTSREGARAVIDQVVEMAARLVKRTAATHERLLSVGVAVPGVVDQASGIVRLAFNISDTGTLDLRDVVAERLGASVTIENNINLAALGEKVAGLGRGVSTLVFLSVGAGVGMGIIVGDELVRGAQGAAGEIGYLPLVSDDPFDPRHRLHGGLEDEIGAVGVLQAYAAARGEAAAGDGAAPEETASSAQRVFELAGGGDAAAQAVVERVATQLGAAIATTCAILDPELVVLGGGIGSNPLILGPVRGAAASLVPMTARIETSRLGERATLHGAIAVALSSARTGLSAAPPAAGAG